MSVRTSVADHNPTAAPPTAAFAPLTDEQFNAFLDAHPGRRASFERHGPARLAEYRARIDRLYALRASPMTAELVELVELATKLRTAARRIVNRYHADEAGRVLEAAGLPLPDPDAMVQGNDADTFREPYQLCLTLAVQLDDFLNDLNAEVGSVLRRTDV